MKMVEFLYRGVSDNMHRNGFALNPKGTTFKRIAEHDGRVRYDGSFTYGESEKIALLYHQVHSGKYPGSGVSFSKCFDVAKKYATNSSETGYVYVLKTENLCKYNLMLYDVNEIISIPTCKDDNEVVIRSANDSPIPQFLVHKIVRVMRDEKTQTC